MAHIIDETSCKMRCCNKCDAYRKELEQIKAAENSGLIIKLPVKIGGTVFVLAECGHIPAQLDGTLYDSDGGYGTATGYYCPYEDNCPHIYFSDDCDKCKDKTAVFEDTVSYIGYDETGITVYTELTNIVGDIGRDIFLTKEEAEKALYEREV